MSKSQQQTRPVTLWKRYGPYAELMRLHMPAAHMVVYWPYLSGCLLAAIFKPHKVDPYMLASSCTTMLIFAVLLHGWGCTWNDIVDRDIDRLVARTASRPLARKAVSVRNASIFGAVQAALWLALIVAVRPVAAMYAVAVLFLTLIYPFAKRFTNFTQVHLGITFSLGILVAASSLEEDMHQLVYAQSTKALTLGLAMFAYVVWTMIVDTIYAFQDVKYDVDAGVKSMAVRFENSPLTLFSALSLVQIALLFAKGQSLEAHALYYISACGGSLGMLTFLLQSLRVNQPAECKWWFERGSVVYGVVTSLGLLSEYMLLRLFL